MIAHILKAFNLPFNKHLLAGKEAYSFSDFSNLLDQYKISTMAVKLNSSNLAQLSFPAITQLQVESNSIFVVLESFDNQSVSYFDGSKTIQEPLGVFEQKWTGNVLLLAKDEFSGEANYEENLAKSKASTIQKIIGFVALACLALSALWLCQNFTMAGWWLLQMLGLGISVLLLINEFGEPSAFIQKLCHVGKSTDCSTVLNSNQSKIFSWLSKLRPILRTKMVKIKIVFLIFYLAFR